MIQKLLPRAVIASVLLAGATVAPVHAGHAKAHADYAHSPAFLAHHAFMKGDASSERRARLGVAISPLSQPELDAQGLEYGVRIDRVISGSPADDAGLEAGDVVTEIGGRPVYSPERMQHLVDGTAGAVGVAVRRDGQPMTLEAAFARAEMSAISGKAVLGIRIQGMTRDLKDAFGAEGDRGVLISQVNDGSAAKAAGLKAGDVIVAIGGRDVVTVRDVHRALGAHAPGDTVDVSILRDREASTIAVALGRADADPQRSAHPYSHRGHGHGGYGHHSPHGYHHGRHGMMPRHGCYKGEDRRRS